MRLEALAFSLLLAGFASSIALAQGWPAGLAKPAATPRVDLCHRPSAPSERYRRISVARAAVEHHMRHGDRLVRTGGCAGLDRP